jgi:putative adenylate-forming enzyme
MTPTSTLFNLPVAAAYDSARWTEAAYDVWQGSRMPAEALARRAESRLQALIAFAREASPFYRRLYRRLPDSPPLGALPPVNKKQLMDHFDDVVTQPAVTRRAVERFIADPGHLGASLAGRYSVWTSSGTTGKPGYFVHDPDALAVYDALESQRFRGVRSAADLARQLINGDRYAMVAATGGHFAGISTVERMRRWVPWMASSMRGFSLLQPIDRLVAELNEFKPTLLAAYPTAAEMLAAEQEAGRLQLRLREVWTGGEFLAESTRARLQRIFDCRVRNSYGASEFLPIAWECPCRMLHANTDWVILEPIDRRGRPVAPGTRSHSVLLSNLANRVQPLIRYDLGDSITLQPEPCACGSGMPALVVEGRQDDALMLPLERGGTVAVVPLALSTVLEDDAHVYDFQVTQTEPRSVTVRLGAGEGVPARTVRRALSAYFDTLGIGQITIGVARRPPARDRVSGKLRRVICRLPQRPVSTDIS